MTINEDCAWIMHPLVQPIYYARQTRFIVLHQQPLPLEPDASTAIIAF